MCKKGIKITIKYNRILMTVYFVFVPRYLIHSIHEKKKNFAVAEIRK